LGIILSTLLIYIRYIEYPTSIGIVLDIVDVTLYVICIIL
jgi:hypothetical protein